MVPEVFRWEAAGWLMRLDRRLLCRVRNSAEVHLTFDDGPDPELTPWVLDELARAGSTATFFLIGQRAERYPALVDRIRAEGHGVGNHTWAHEDAWRTPADHYMASVERGMQATGATLFRPPYGHITPRLIGRITPLQRIVQWQVLAGDFLPDMDGERLSRRVLSRSRAGSIVVLHDTQRCAHALRPALPAILAALQHKGLRSKAVPEHS